MITRLLTILGFLLFTQATVYSQKLQPLDLAKRIFSKDSIAGIDKYTTGEYKGRPNGRDLQKGSTTRFLLLGQTDNKAVVAMTVLDGSGKGLDTYLHFVRDTAWKMCAFRALAMTGIIEQVKAGLEKMTPQQIDDVISQSKNNKKGKKYAAFSSRADYNFQLGNAKLTLGLDDSIIAHFLENKAEFQRIKDSALKELETKKAIEEAEIHLVEKLKPDYEKLYISSVSFNSHGFGNCINFLIGGMVDNSVGYLYVKSKKDIPQMNASRVIMIREIGDGWYIYKTT